MSLFLLSFSCFLAAFCGALCLARGFSGSDDEAKRILRRLSGQREAKPSRLRLERREGMSDIPFLRLSMKTLEPFQNLGIWLGQSGLGLSASVFLLLTCVLGLSAFTFAASIGAAVQIAVFCGMSAGTLPFLVAGRKRAIRFKRFSAAFPDAVGRMASSLRAGYSLQMALETVAEDSGTVISEEFRIVLAQMEVGQSFEAALQKMLERVDTPDLRLFIASVTIQRESGGNLAELLDNLEATIQDRFSLQRELESATAQAKLSGLVLSLLPLFVGFFVFLIHPGYIRFFFDDPVGKQLFTLCVAGQVTGLWVIKKIVSIQM